MAFAVGSVFLFISVLMIVGGYIYVRSKICRFSREVFGTDSLMEGFQYQEEEYASTPKSVSGMTDLCLPRIKADFPEFTYSDFKANSERAILLYLDALEKGNTSRLKDFSSMFQEQVRLEIENNAQQNLKEDFDDVHIHRTEIAEYKKGKGRTDIILQTALEYKYRRYNALDERPEPKRQQARLTSTWSFVQDVDQLQEYVTGVSCNCPNCGAPIRNLGVHVCPYCGSGVELINLRSWRLLQIQRG